MKKQAAPASSSVLAIGIMSGTSLDGVDAVALRTNGEEQRELVDSVYLPFPAEFRTQLRAIARGDVPLTEVLRAERTLMEMYEAALHRLEAQGKTPLAKVAVIGAHGQTIRHLPQEGLTWQLADPSWLAERTGVPVVMDFRRRDMAAGGEGAPLVPLYHAALLAAQECPCMVLNVGGVANVTWLGKNHDIRATDCGPGVGLLDQWAEQTTGLRFDVDGRLALAGKVHEDLVRQAFGQLNFWRRPVPRSADRWEFAHILEWLVEKKLSAEDGAATLTAITAMGVAETLNELLPEGQKAMEGHVWCCGGGANNPAVVQALQERGLKAKPIAELGLQAETIEAECFAWLAVRRLRHLPLSLPGTTGARHATVGGVLTA